MPRLLFILTFSALSFSAYAQEFEKGHVFVGGGLASEGINSGIEPAYRISDLFSIGMKLELSWILVQNDGASQKPNFATVSSVSGNLKYYLAQKPKFRPYIGIGVGIYNLSWRELINNNFEANIRKKKAGVYPRIGIEIGQLSLNVDYNIVDSEDPFSAPSGSISNSNYNYLTVRIAVMIGGRRL